MKRIQFIGSYFCKAMLRTQEVLREPFVGLTTEPSGQETEAKKVAHIMKTYDCNAMR